MNKRTRDIDQLLVEKIEGMVSWLVESKERSTINSCLAILGEGREFIRDKLAEFQSDMDSSSHEEQFQEILRCMSYVLAHAARYSMRENVNTDVSLQPDIGEKVEFYFWPGYDSIHTSQRILLQNDGDEYSGFGYSFIYDDYNYEEELYSDSPTSYWFNRALLPISIGSETGFPTQNTFYPGSTHRWVTAGGEFPQLVEKYFKSEKQARRKHLFNERPPIRLRNLRLLHICCSQSAKVSSVKVDREKLSLTLSSIDPSKWGDFIASNLNDPGILDYEIKWPAPTFGDVGDGNSDSQNETNRKIWRDLYSLWLAASFVPTTLSENDYLLLEKILITSKKDCPPIYHHLRSPSPSYPALNRSRVYSHWYTIFLNRTVDMSVENRMTLTDNLGSAMLMSSHELSHKFFRVATPWIESVYGLLRYVESAMLIATEAAQHAKASALKGAAKAWAHEVKNHTNPLIGYLDGARKKLEEYSLFHFDEGLESKGKEEVLGAEKLVVESLHGIALLNAISVSIYESLSLMDRTSRLSQHLRPLPPFEKGGKELLDGILYYLLERKIETGRSDNYEIIVLNEKAWDGTSFENLYSTYCACRTGVHYGPKWTIFSDGRLSWVLAILREVIDNIRLEKDSIADGHSLVTVSWTYHETRIGQDRIVLELIQKQVQKRPMSYYPRGIDMTKSLFGLGGAGIANIDGPLFTNGKRRADRYFDCTCKYVIDLNCEIDNAS